MCASDKFEPSILIYVLIVNVNLVSSLNFTFVRGQTKNQVGEIVKCQICVIIHGILWHLMHFPFVYRYYNHRFLDKYVVFTFNRFF